MERTGVPPTLYPQYAALRGDPSDNLPGVPGVGEKTAAKLITTYGGIDGIYEHLDAQTPKLRASLAEHEERVRENARVMVLLRDVPIEVDLDAAVLEPKMAEVKRLFEFLEFRSLLDRLNEALGAKAGGVASAVGAGRRGRGRPRGRASPRPSRCSASSSRFDVAPSGPGAAGRSALTGLAVVLDGAAGEVAWLPAERGHVPVDPGRAGRRPAVPGPPVEAAAAGAGRARRRRARAGHGHGDRRLPARSGRDPLRHRRPAGALHRRPAARGRRAGRPARLRRGGGRTRRRSRPARRWPSAGWRRPSWPRWRRRAWPRCTPTSRTRSCGCWPAWRTSASRSTGPSSRPSTPA